ncbi:MAG TPA: hypothetical protein VFT62_03000 [Mycobacteriales bacterium]|nr:hypothetical protein [Mycobacteriales bacterium]
MSETGRAVNADETPIFAELILDLGRERDAADARTAHLARLVADVEALHEPDGNGECPTCGTEAPCVTLLLLRDEVSLEQACAAVREGRPLDLSGGDSPEAANVPKIKDLLDAATPGVDRFFDALLGNAATPDAADRRLA